VAADQHHGQLILHSALQEALARFGRPEIFNTDQVSQFTSAAFTGMLIGAGPGAHISRLATGRLWQCCAKGTAGPVGDKAVDMITTRERCPHAHSGNSNTSSSLW
jgi:hypothetical protein